MKRKHHLYTALLLGALLLGQTSCSDSDGDSLPDFATDLETIELTADGGTARINVSAAGTWTAEADADWYMLSPANGEGTTLCSLKADSSYLYTSREGLLTFRTLKGNYQVRIVQEGYAPVISLDNVTQDTIHIPHYKPLDQAYVDVTAMANVAFKVEIPAEAADWLSLDESTPSGFTPQTTVPRRQTFRFRFKTHVESDATREAVVTFTPTAGNAAVATTLKIIQDKAPQIIPSREGDSLALLSVARMLNSGAAWNTSRPITHWNNVDTRPVTYDYYDAEGRFVETRTEERVVGVRFSLIDTKETLPDQIRHLDQLETLVVMANVNSFLREIEIGDAVTHLKKLRSLSLFGYGVSKLPEDMGEKMPALEELNLGANNFRNFDDIIRPLRGLGGRLKYLQLNGNRMVSSDITKNLSNIPDGIDPSSGRHIGLMDEVPTELFTTFPNLEYLNLSYNFLYGSLPELYPSQFDGGVVMPRLKYLSVNLNRLSGDAPAWITSHPYRGCWAGSLLIFNQEGKDLEGKTAGLSKESERAFLTDIPDCPSDDEETEALLMSLEPLTQEEKESGWPSLNGYWRYYERFK